VVIPTPKVEHFWRSKAAHSIIVYIKNKATDVCFGQKVSVKLIKSTTVLMEFRASWKDANHTYVHNKNTHFCQLHFPFNIPVTSHSASLLKLNITMK